MRILTDIFKPTPADLIITEQLYEAQRRLVEHEAAAEHHAALTEMYRRRVERLGGAEAVYVETVAIDLKTGRRLRA